MHNPRVIDSNTRKVQFFFGVQMSKKVKELDENQVEFCKENKIVLVTKLTRVEHTKRIGFVEGINQ